MTITSRTFEGELTEHLGHENHSHLANVSHSLNWEGNSDMDTVPEAANTITA